MGHQHRGDLRGTGPGGVELAAHEGRGRRRIDAPIELVEYEPSRLLAIISGAKGFAVRSTQSFRAVGEDSTEVVEVLEMRLGGARQAV